MQTELSVWLCGAPDQPAAGCFCVRSVAPDPVRSAEVPEVAARGAGSFVLVPPGPERSAISRGRGAGGREMHAGGEGRRGDSATARSVTAGGVGARDGDNRTLRSLCAALEPFRSI